MPFFSCVLADWQIVQSLDQTVPYEYTGLARPCLIGHVLPII